MRYLFLKKSFKFFLICTLVVALFIAGIAVYMQFFGKSLLESALSNMFGSKIRFDGISINLNQYSANFKGFSIPSEFGFDEKSIFKAEDFSLVLNKERFESNKEIVFDRIIIKKAVLNIERNREGVLNISCLRVPEPRCAKGIAYADEASGVINLYNFAKSIKELYIQDSTIIFKDYYIPQGPFVANFDNLDVSIITKAQDKSGLDVIPMKVLVGLGIPGTKKNGNFVIDADMYVSKKKIDMFADMHTENIDLTQFLVYFNNYTPFSFSEGLFSSETSATIKDNKIDSRTTIVFHELKLLIDSGMENAQFLEASVNKLAPYLMSSEGDIIFDFVIKGPLDKPKIGLGSHVKSAIGLMALDEMNKILQQLQQLSR